MALHLKPDACPPGVAAVFAAEGMDPPQVYRTSKGHTVFVGREAVAPGDQRWHLSISHPQRLPAWSDLVQVAHALQPNVCFVQALPPRTWWVNVHPQTLHLWEVKDPNLIAQWRAEGQTRGDQPT